MIASTILTIFRPKQLVFIMVMAVTLLMSSSMFASAPAHAATPAQTTVQQCKHDFLGLEPWYQYIGVELDSSGTCEVKCFNIFDQGGGVGQPANTCGQTKSDIPLILLAVIDDLLRIAGLAAVAFVIYGAFEYVGSQGNSEVTARAQSMILNALIGLAIATTAIVIVNFLGNNLGGT